MADELEIRIGDGVAAVAPAAWDALVGEGSPFLEHAFLAGLELTGCVGEEAGWLPLPKLLCIATVIGGVVLVTWRSKEPISQKEISPK